MWGLPLWYEIEVGGVRGVYGTWFLTGFWVKIEQILEYDWWGLYSSVKIYGYYSGNQICVQSCSIAHLAVLSSWERARKIVGNVAGFSL